MSNPDRLSGLDSSFLNQEGSATPMHVAICGVFEGPPPAYEELLAAIEARLHLIPRYRQRLAMVPFGQGRPVWVDDPHFQLTYHVRHTALPRPGGEEQLRWLAGREFSQSLDRSRPLWELWLIEGLAGNRFAVLAKTHHALTEALGGVDIASVILDRSSDPGPVRAPGSSWVRRPLPTGPQLLADALVERATAPRELLGAARCAASAPGRLTSRMGTTTRSLGALIGAGAPPAPKTLFNVRVGPHRRVTWIRRDLRELKGIKDVLGGTVNDVVLAGVAGALGFYMRLHDEPPDGVVLKALVPVVVSAESERGTAANRLVAVSAPLPVGILDPAERLAVISEAMSDVKHSGQAVGAQMLTELSGFAPPTILAQAARLQASERLFNLAITNVPGPQTPLYLLGRRLVSIHPMVPLAANTALGIAVMSYDGTVDFGLTCDYDALPDIETLANELHSSMTSLAIAAGVTPSPTEETVARRRRQMRAIT